MKNNRASKLPQLVIDRAKSAGAVGEMWLANLDILIAELENQWKISVQGPLSGGTHAYVAYADGHDGAKYVLKIDMPEDLGGDLENGILALKIVNGNGYAKLFAYDLDKRACLLERLGKPISRLNYSIDEQLEIICDALQKSWQTQIRDTKLPDGSASVTWFRDFIRDTWEELHRPCSQHVIDQALLYLRSREENLNPAEYVLLHGDAHANNTLQDLSKGNSFKLIDPDGIIYEKAYDLGVLIREWIDEYSENPLQKAKDRCEYLQCLTGVPTKGIWEWGFLQTISTSFVFLKIGQQETGRKMLDIAESWTKSLIKEKGVHS